MESKDKISEQIEKVFRDLWDRIHQREIIEFAEEFTDMIDTDVIEFLAIYLLGFTRDIFDKEEAWLSASLALDEILSGKRHW